MLLSAIATQLYAANRRDDPDAEGLKGLAAGVVFSALARRTPIGAAIFAGALIARRLHKARQKLQADKAAALLARKHDGLTRAERVAANGQSARRPLDRKDKAIPRRKPRLATLH